MLPDAFVCVVEEINFVSVTHAEKFLVVDYGDILSRFYVFHLVRRLAIGGKDLVEFRQDLETQGLIGFRIAYFYAVGRNVNGDTVKHVRGQGRTREGKSEYDGQRRGE